ncbi:MAG: cytochrome c-type biogenesis CcmF C-terminal domain-containing protein [Acidimicrobiales bacterium]|jgi:cytochrome c-type biogenesis protein CcmF
MNAALGSVGVALSLLAAVGGVVTIGLGLVSGRPSLYRHARWFALWVLGGAIVSTVAMERALLLHDFSIAFVAANNSRETPLLYSITGMWSALQGSILLWALILGGYLAAMTHAFRRRASDPLVAWSSLIGLGVAVFFFALMAGPANPFAHVIGAVRADGSGPNPLLQDNPLIAFHPVLLYLGFVGFTVPFSFAIATLVTGRFNEGWLLETRRWTLFAWAFLTIGIMLGAWWSYQVLGWGGFWGWDPVENAALLPWLCGTAYLHSVMVQERRGLLRVWNLSLLVAAFSLTILGTFLTRSGVLVSVHSFSNSNVGPLLLGFFGLVVALGVGLIAWRGDRLRAPGTIDAAVSREGAFLVNNLLFAGFALVVLLGTVFPLLVEALNGQQVTVGRPYFDTMTLPLGLALLFFMAVAPALPWRKAGEGVLRRRLAVPAWVAAGVVVVCVLAGVRGFAPLLAFGLGGFAGSSAARQLVLAAVASHRAGAGAWRALFGRANGGMIVHLGVVIVAVALAAATSYGQRTQLVLKPGQAVGYDGHVFTYVGARQFRLPNKSGEIATVLVDGAPFHPAISVFSGSEGIGTPAVDSSVREDTYLTLADVNLSSRGSATIDVVIQPMVMWLWVGGTITAFGAVLAAIPSRRRRVGGGQRSGLDEETVPSGGPRPDGYGSEAAASREDLELGAPGDQAPAPVGAGTGS